MGYRIGRFTDHKPLTSAESPKNTNDKIIRWKAIVDEPNAKIVIEDSLHPATKIYFLFQNKMRHIIQFRKKDSLLNLLRDVVKPEVVNAIH